MRASAVGIAKLGASTARDLCSPQKIVECNLCGWRGAGFYTNLGPGYNAENEVCPRCLSIRRYRSLAMVLDAHTGFFAPDTSVIEVAPTREFQAYCLRRKQHRNYRSFDFENFAMEQGDITAMRFPDGACDYFLCLHVLEHVLADEVALMEIRRVLRPGGSAILQVPIDYSLEHTVEYGKPDPLETGHVRRYSEKGWTSRLLEAGFSVRKASVAELVPQAAVRQYGLNPEPFYLATLPE